LISCRLHAQEAADNCGHQREQIAERTTGSRIEAAFLCRNAAPAQHELKAPFASSFLPRSRDTKQQTASRRHIAAN
jgi:hypothetical protein